MQLQTVIVYAYLHLILKARNEVYTIDKKTKHSSKSHSMDHSHTHIYTHACKYMHASTHTHGTLSLSHAHTYPHMIRAGEHTHTLCLSLSLTHTQAPTYPHIHTMIRAGEQQPKLLAFTTRKWWLSPLNHLPRHTSSFCFLFFPDTT